MFLISSSLETTKTLAFLLGATFISERIFLIFLTASLIVSTAFSSLAKSYSSVNSGHFESIIVSSSSCKLQKISSVINGIYGCKSFNESINTFLSVQSAAFLVSSSSLYNLGLTISIYQSQNSSQINS